MAEKEMVSHAINLAKQGFKIFPLPSGKKFPPTFNNFTERATNSVEVVEQYWSGSPNQNKNIGIITSSFGLNEALVIVDIDSKNGKLGFESLKQLKIEGKVFPPTRTVKTPNDGAHLVYRSKTPVRQGVNVLGNGIDIRSNGGYVVAPGSIVDGKTYIADEHEIVEAPQWLLDACGKAKKKSPPNTDFLNNVDPLRAWARAIQYLRNEAPVAIQGEGGDHTTFTVACVLKDFGLTREKCLEILIGGWNQKCLPPWSEIQLKQKIENAYLYSTNLIGSDAPENHFSKINDKPPVTPNLVTNPVTPNLVTNPVTPNLVTNPVTPNLVTNPVTPNPTKRRFTLEAFKDIELDLTSTGLIQNLLDHSAMSVVYGESNSGKTFFAIDVSAHLALGREWHGRRVERGGVLYVAAEGGKAIHKRIVAFRMAHQLEGQEIPFLLARGSIDLLNAKADTQPLIDEIREAENLFGIPIKLVVIDTLARAISGGNENAPDDMGAFVGNADKIRNATKAHVMIVHHTGKDRAKGARGHSSLRAATDTEIEIADQMAKVTKQRDQESGQEIGFSLEQVEVGIDSYNEPIRSCVLRPRNLSAERDFGKKVIPATSVSGKGLALLRELAEILPTEPPKNLAESLFESLEGLTGVSIDMWKTQFLDKYYHDSDRRTKSSAASRCLSALLDSGHVKERDGYAWIEKS